MKKIGQVLVDIAGVESNALEECLFLQSIRGGRIGKILLQEGLLEEEHLLRALSIQLDIPFLPCIHPEEIAYPLLENISLDYLERMKVLPLDIGGLPGYFLSTADPLFFTPFDDLRVFTGRSFSPAMVPSGELLNVFIHLKNHARYPGLLKAV